MRKDLAILQKALEKLGNGFDSFPDSLHPENAAAIETALLRTAEKLHDNYPYFQPNYAGQMIKPPHAVARLAYQLALYINPNNHALDGGRASSEMEKDCIRRIGAMFGWESPLGHLTGGGTMANLEALWMASKTNPGRVLASDQSHYTHQRISAVLGLPFDKVAADDKGRMSLEYLSRQLAKGDIGTVVVTLGTTGLGSVDPLEEILQLRAQRVAEGQSNFRIHIDAAYGGYFKLATNLSEYTARQYALMHEADSIVVDPHKHGLQPYGCGCILFKNPADGVHYKHDSPYTYFSSAELHLGEISLECSRAGAAAVALWTTMEVFPLERNGAFAQQLEQCREAALKLYEGLEKSEQFKTLLPPELDIVLWAPNEPSLSEMSQASSDLFRKAAEQNLHLALINYPAEKLPETWVDIQRDAETVTLLRSCLMKPEHGKAVPEILQLLEEL